MGIQRLGFWAISVLAVALTLSSRATELSAFERVQIVANTLISISNSPEPPEVLHAQLCQLIEENMDIEGIGNTLMGSFRKTAPQSSREDFYSIVSQTIAVSFDGLFGKQGLSVEIGKVEELSERRVDVYVEFTDASGIPYSVIFALARQAEGGPLVRDAKVEGLSLLLSKRGDMNHRLRKLRRQKSLDPVKDLAGELAGESTPCP